MSTDEKEVKKDAKEPKEEKGAKEPKEVKGAKEVSEVKEEKGGAEAKKVVAPKKGKKRVKKNVATGVVCILSTFNNTIVSVTDATGNVIAWSSAGVCGFKGSRKGTPFAAQLAAEDAVRKAMDHGLRSATVLVGGPGAGRESALRSLQKTGVRITGIRDTTPIPHNGCRPPKRRRV